MAELDRKPLRINSADVVHETIDGEVIVIDLARGSYYNLAGGGVRIWEMLGAGASAEEITSSLGADESQRRQVEAFLEQLLSEALVVPDEGAAGPNGIGAAASPAEFEPPRFEKYDDMQDYFLLDPIHEVDASGWPKPKPD